jgi:hypothetical protein
MPSGSSLKRERQYERGAAGAARRTREQLYAEARKRNIKGRSNMTKAQLERALAR